MGEIKEIPHYIHSGNLSSFGFFLPLSNDEKQSAHFRLQMRDNNIISIPHAKFNINIASPTLGVRFSSISKLVQETQRSPSLMLMVRAPVIFNKVFLLFIII